MTADASAPALGARLPKLSPIGATGLVLVLALVGFLLYELQDVPSQFVQATLIGLTNGAVYGLIALGYTLVYGILELINFAHGDVFMLGGMFAITFSTHFFNLHHGEGFAIVPIVFATLLLSMAACGAINATIEFVAYRPLRSAPRLAPLITAIGVSFIIENVGLALERPDVRQRAGRVPTLERLLDRRRRLRVEPLDRGVHHRAGAPRPALFGSADAPGQGDARDRAGQGRGGDHGHQRQPHDLVHVRDRRGSRRRCWASLYALWSTTVRYDQGFQLGLISFTAAVLGGIGNLPGAVLGAVADRADPRLERGPAEHARV